MAVVRDVVLEVARRHGLPAEPVAPLRGPGSVNHVFCLGSGPERHVVRIPIDGLRQDEFEVEQWCLEQAAAHAIPSPGFVGRGDVSGTPYMVLTYVDGAGVDEVGDLTSWETLGRYGRLAHGFEWSSGPDALFTRFGRDPDDAWRRHLLHNAEQLTGSDPLTGLGVYPASGQPRLRDLLVLEALDRVRWALDKRPDLVAGLVRDANETLRL